jgi:uncharacterized protein (TIGR02421 family)
VGVKKSYKSLAEINQKAYEAAKNIRLLGHLSWPAAVEEQLIAALEKNQKDLPEIQYPPFKYSGEKEYLTTLSRSFTPSDPMEQFTHKTILSYLDTIALNEAVGTPKFQEHSIRVFGTPGDPLPNSAVTNTEAAQQIVTLSEEFNSSYIQEPEVCYTAEAIKDYLEDKIRHVFGSNGPSVVIVPELSAKATATAKRIKVRSGTHFTEYDFDQLLNHEVLTHSLTALNGQNQKILKVMGCNSLRALKTQEGLATFAEVITGSIDIHRLKRVSLRILAIDMALNGASFREVYKFMRSKGQNPHESYNSTQRIFRGGFPDQNIIFTKDCIYLDGLMNVHTLFRWAMKHNKMDLCHLLLCGRMAIEDVHEMLEFYEHQWITPPQFLPAWYRKIGGLAGTLTFSLLANLVSINRPQSSSKLAA